jgi:hypothetical protein
MPESATNENSDDFREHCRAALRAWGESWKTLVPEGFFEKTKEGQREALLAARSLIDFALDKLGVEEEEKAAKPKQKVKVNPD